MATASMTKSISRIEELNQEIMELFKKILAEENDESQRNFKYSTSWPDFEDVEKMVNHLKKQGFKYFKVQASMEEFEGQPKTTKSVESL